MRSDVRYKLDELAEEAGTSPRTVRYYVQRGLIPAPAFRGKDSAYGHEHLVRLRAIRKLQDAFFPLDAIAAELERRSIAEIERIADGKELPTTQHAPPASSDLGSGGVVLGVTNVPDLRDAKERVFRRIEIAPGVELSIADDAPHESRAIVEKMLRGIK